MNTEPKSKKTPPPEADEAEGNVDPNRLAVVRMPTAFLKWVISQPLPKEDRQNLWLDTLPPGSAEKAPRRQRKMAPWVFTLLIVLVTAGVAGGVGLFVIHGMNGANEGSAPVSPLDDVTNAEPPEAEPEPLEAESEVREAAQAEPAREPTEERVPPAPPKAPVSDPSLASKPIVQDEPPAAKPNPKPSPPSAPKPAGVAPIIGGK